MLSLAGVSDETIAHEYALTEIGLASWKEPILQHLLRHPALEGKREGAENMLSAR
jgi:hypothetical protein